MIVQMPSESRGFASFGHRPTDRQRWNADLLLQEPADVLVCRVLHEPLLPLPAADGLSFMRLSDRTFAWTFVHAPVCSLEHHARSNTMLTRIESDRYMQIETENRND